MSFSYVARQPILDVDKNTVAYELLFRDGPHNAFPEIEAELATSRLLSEQFFCAPYNALGNKLGFINFPYQSLINQIPTLFPKDKVIIEVLEDCLPTDELFAALQSLTEMGYVLALDDFVPSPEWMRFLPLITIIKFDLRLTPIEKAAMFIKRSQLVGRNIKFVAEKVETYQEYKQALAVGFTYFQGYFFSRPEIIKQKAIQSSFLTIIKLCKVISEDDIDYVEVEKIVSTDVTLSYKLLRYVNASGTLTSEIKSFRQALTYLGQQNLRKFISLTAIASTTGSKPESLYSLSIQRARFSELIAQCSNRHKSKAFLTGMFSLLDSLLDQSLEVIVNAIAIDKNIKEALLFRTGEQGQILSLVIAYEQADWDNVVKLREILNIDHDSLLESYQQAISWTDQLFVTRLETAPLITQ
ncbi:EAL and HDOD domain-containing protein [Psychromonas sp.]|uniref:EAL and HDOD domain-containing protein n=1 Tax=Psychromonas sp. TaxID=1884585 RepID=UPI0039E2CDF8